jgi:hypothetical protein
VLNPCDHIAYGMETVLILNFELVSCTFLGQVKPLVIILVLEEHFLGEFFVLFFVEVGFGLQVDILVPELVKLPLQLVVILINILNRTIVGWQPIMTALLFC